MNSGKLTFRQILLCVMIVVFIATWIFILSLPKIPDDLNKIAISQPTYIYAENGQVIKVLTNRDPVSIENMSPHFLNGILSIEDKNFYHHHGISKRGIFRAFLNNLRNRRITGGGSTITQQLVKNLYFSFEQSWIRKIKEALLTFQIERQFSKEAILEAYANQIDFDSGIYGIELASQTYFSKHANELTLEEAALLVGIPNYPARYNPYTHEDIAKERRNYILWRMFKTGCITEEEYRTAKESPIQCQRLNRYFGSAEYFISYILNELRKKYGKNAVNYGGLHINTTLNPHYQYKATQAIKQGLNDLDQLIGLKDYEEAPWEEKLTYPQGALIALNPHTGAIQAMVGGRDYQRSPYNRAVTHHRHVGSTIKPIIYFAALDQKIAKPTSVFKDEPIEFRIHGSQIWSPNNWDNQFMGPMVLKYALMKSRNPISAQLVEKLSPRTVIQYARELGITSPMEEHLSLSLGAVGISPLEMASAYGVIASQGRFHRPFYINRITDSENKLIKKHTPKIKKVHDKQTFYQIIDMLKGVMESGTGQGIKQNQLHIPCAGKTGTSNEFRDSWFIGFTPDLVVVVWTGFDDNHPMIRKNGQGITGASAALPIFARFMLEVYYKQNSSEFPIPPGIVFETVDIKTGKIPGPTSESIQVALKYEID